GEDRAFVENLWARRKIGYLLDQIRGNGENRELVQEVVTIARRHGIATPYTSYLIVPDAPMRVTGTGLPAPAPTKDPPARKPDRPDVRLVQPTGQTGQIGQIGQIGQTGQIGQFGQYQIGQIGQIGGTGQIGAQTGPLIPNAPAQRVGQIGQIGQIGQLGQFG